MLHTQQGHQERIHVTAPHSFSKPFVKKKKKNKKNDNLKVYSPCCCKEEGKCENSWHTRPQNQVSAKIINYVFVHFQRWQFQRERRILAYVGWQCWWRGRCPWKTSLLPPGAAGGGRTICCRALSLGSVQWCYLCYAINKGNGLVWS